MLVVAQGFLQKLHLRLGCTQREISLRHRCLGRQARCGQIITGGLRRSLVGIYRARQLAPQIHFPTGTQAHREVVVDAAAARHVLPIGVAVGAATGQRTRAAARRAQGGQLRCTAAGHGGLCRSHTRHRLNNAEVADCGFILQLVERGVAINRPPLFGHRRSLTGCTRLRRLPDTKRGRLRRGFLELGRNIQSWHFVGGLQRAGRQQHRRSHGQQARPAQGRMLLKSELLALIHIGLYAFFIQKQCLHILLTWWQGPGRRPRCCARAATQAAPPSPAAREGGHGPAAHRSLAWCRG